MSIQSTNTTSSSANKLGFGFLRLPTTDGKSTEMQGAGSQIDYEYLRKLVDEYMKGDVRYFDTAYIYLNGESEKALKETLTSRYPRDSYRIASKLPVYKCKTVEDCFELFEEQCERCGVEFFDVYMLHALDDENYEIAKTNGAFDFLRQLKAEGKAAQIGFSFHANAELLDEILTTHPEMDYVLLQINYADWESSSIQSRRCYETAVRHGMKVIVMEPLKGGALARIAPAELGLRFCAELENVEIVLSGMNSIEQIRENLEPMQSLTAAEKEKVSALARQLAASPEIPCTACRYCVPACPIGIPIPNYLQLYNELQRNPDDKWKIEPVYNLTAAGLRPASDCTQCTSCAHKCPQHLPIPDLIAKVSEAFDK